MSLYQLPVKIGTLKLKNMKLEHLLFDIQNMLLKKNGNKEYK